MVSFEILRRVALVRTDVSEERIVSIIELARLVFLRTRLRLLIITNVPSSRIFVTLIMEAIHSSETRFLQEPHIVTSQKMTFFKRQDDE
jgi:hypothetical protein